MPLKGIIYDKKIMDPLPAYSHFHSETLNNTTFKVLMLTDAVSTFFTPIISVNIGFRPISCYMKMSSHCLHLPKHTWASFYNLLILLMSPEPLNRGQSIYWDIRMDSPAPCLSPPLKRWSRRHVTEIGCDSAKMRLTNILMRKCQPCSRVPTTPDSWPWERESNPSCRKRSTKYKWPLP